MTTRMQHYVWRHYLEGWSRENDRVYCLRNGTLFQTNPKNIMVERDFYRLVPLSKKDIQFFSYWLKEKCGPSMRATNQRTFDAFARIANGNESIQSANSATDAEKAYVRSLAITAAEELHQEIENRALPAINDLRQERLDFLSDQAATINFFHFLGHQYFRTKRMRGKIDEILKTVSPDYDLSRLHHVFCYCCAENFGGSLFVDRRRLRFSFLRNHGAGLITGDQPIVNVARGETLTHDDVMLYYPLSSNLGLLVGFGIGREGSVDVPDEVAQQLNEAITFLSDQFLVAASDKLLRRFVDKPREKPDVLSLLW